MSVVVASESALRFSNRLGVPVEMSVCDTEGRPELSLLHPPQTLVVSVVNRSKSTLRALPETVFTFSFRPQTIVNPESITLGQDAVDWALAPPPELISAARMTMRGSIHTTPVLQAIEVVPRRPIDLAPGATMEFRLEGVVADPRGGTRHTRVEMAYRGLAILPAHIEFDSDLEPGDLEPGDLEPGDGDRVELETIDGAQLQQLSIKRIDEEQVELARRLRSGSVARGGPFTAGFNEAPQAFNQGKALNRLSVTVANTSGRPLVLSNDDDLASRFVLDYTVGTDSAAWGLLRSRHDHLVVTNVSEGWEADGVTVRRTASNPWSGSDTLTIELEMHTSALSGLAQLVLRFENLPHEDDGELILLVEVAPSAHNAFIEPLQLWGDGASLEFYGGEYLAAGGEPDAAVALDHGHTGGGRRPLRIESSRVVLEGGLHVRWPGGTGGHIHVGHDPVDGYGQLRIGHAPDPARNWIDSRNDAPLYINGAGGPVTIGPGAPIDARLGADLTVRDMHVTGNLRIVRPDGEAELHFGHGRRSGRGHLRIGSDESRSWVNTDGQRLTISAGGAYIDVEGNLSVSGLLALAGALRQGDTDVLFPHEWVRPHDGKLYIAARDELRAVEAYLKGRVAALDSRIDALRESLHPLVEEHRQRRRLLDRLRNPFG
jgi:hypothetical protein